MMRPYSEATIAWIILTAMTLFMALFGPDNSPTGRPQPSFAGGFILLIAIFKARLVALYFMELQIAPFLLRAAFELWMIAVAAGMIGAYYWTVF
ncbi:cytochrome C oxidase subunit IV family protein [Marinicaulis aureus]|uniref:Cytochrome C oxidase subunit IV family protein n=1 Tax=Hyphococcus aureus TaxID=2666033 RepID=A0ABW1L056_9PROT